jgi:glutathione synthase/RimK-type ligase-like ATP-grasp enzyme
MKRIAFATSAAEANLSEDDLLVRNRLRAADVEIVPLIWDDPVASPNAFDAVVVRSCWDYHLKTAEFLQWLARLEQEKVRLWNPVPLVKWNLDKHYLAELARKDVPVVETVWIEPGNSISLESVLHQRDWREAVVKPAVSAGAHCTFRVTPESAARHQKDLDAILTSSSAGAMLQRFIPEVLEGEWSLLFFGGNYSHTVLKRPRSGDFRVQLHHGGTTTLVQPEPELIAHATSILAAAPMSSLYARVDLVRSARGPLLMELELIDPFLYLGYDEHAPERWANVLIGALGN